MMNESSQAKDIEAFFEVALLINCLLSNERIYDAAAKRLCRCEVAF